METSLVTVVTPSYNHGRFIRSTIESVLSQDYPGIEYIIMDGGSTDETASVVKDYASRLTFISERDRGQSHAINKGFRMGRGEIVSWLNSDDYYLPGAITAAVGGLKRNPAAGAVYGEGYLVDPEGRISCRFPYTQPINLWKLVHLSDYILQQTVFFRRDVLDQLGYLDEDLHYTMDWDILIRIATTHGLEYIPEFMGCLREHPEAKSSAGGHRRIRELHSVLRRHSGRRLPPGSIVYGLDTYQHLWCDWLETRSPGWLKPLSRLAQRSIRLGAGRIIGHTIEHSQGLYANGWAADRLHYLLPPGGERIVIEGSLPAEAPRLRGQTLSVHGNQVPLGTFRLTPGEFQVVIDLPAALRNKLLKLEVVASRSLPPTRSGLPGDGRRLAFELKRIDWSTSTPDAPLTDAAGAYARPSGRTHSSRDGALMNGNLK